MAGQFAILSVPQMTATLRLLNEDSDAEFLAHPRVVTSNNMKATIKIVRQQPVPQLNFNEQTAQAVFSGFQDKEFGNTLTVTPQDTSPQPEGYSLNGWTAEAKQQYLKEWHAAHPEPPAKLDKVEMYSAPRGYDDTADHIANFFRAVETREHVVEDDLQWPRGEQVRDAFARDSDQAECQRLAMRAQELHDRNALFRFRT